MGKTAYLYPGQGSQTPGMGQDLYEKSEAAKEVFDEACEVLGYDLKSVCFEGPEELLKETENAQPALLVMSLACFEALQEKEKSCGKMLIPKADYMAGHSLGEYTALALSGALSYADAQRLARKRGRLMQAAGEKTPGSMAAVIGMEEAEVQKICGETGVWIANYNCKGQIIISGETAAVLKARRMAKKEGAKLVLPLQVSGAFHSPLMQPAVEGLKQALDEIRFQTMQIPVIGNTDAQPIPQDADAIRRELTEQLCSSVQWEKTIQQLAEAGVDTFVEIGAGEVLGGLVKRICPEAIQIHIGSISDLEQLEKECR